MEKGQYEKLRFWGKIIGTEKNYYIAEVEQNAEEEADEEEGNEEGNENEDGNNVDDEEVEAEEDPLPKSAYKPPPSVPKEERGTGVNKSTYYVCNYRMFLFSNEILELIFRFFLAGAPWVKLPLVTPAQIAQARKLKVFFTGDLAREIKSYPAYPGTEKNYLRAQIARISATTHVSPAGRFKFSDVMKIDIDRVFFFSIGVYFRKKKKQKKKVENKIIKIMKILLGHHYQNYSMMK